MTLLKYNGKEWETLTREQKALLPEEEKKNVIYLDDYLKKRLDYAKARLTKDWDVVGIIDGEVGVGKSTLGKTIGWYMMDTKLTMDHICIGTDEFIDRVEKFPKGSAILLDESSLSLGSTDFMKQKFKTLMNIFDVCRQQNHFLILIAPEFFRLARPIAVNRARFLINCYEKKGYRGFFKYFGTKKKRELYEIGKKNYSSYAKPRANFIGRFTNFEPFPDYKELKKDKSFKEVIRSGVVAKKPLTEKDLVKRMILKRKAKNPNITGAELAEIFSLDKATIYDYITEIREESLRKTALTITP